MKMVVNLKFITHRYIPGCKCTLHIRIARHGIGKFQQHIPGYAFIFDTGTKNKSLLIGSEILKKVVGEP